MTLFPFRQPPVCRNSCGAFLYGLLLPIFVCISPAANSTSLSNKLPIDDHQLQERRQNYSAAKKAFRENKKVLYEKLKVNLKEYPLYPYLEYSEIVSQLNRLSYPKIDRFLEKHPESHLADQLLKRWLQYLARQKDWHNYRRYYKSGLNSTSLHCHYLWSQLKDDDKTIYSQITNLWNVGKSQPDACDKPFDAWRQQGYLTPEIAWERHKKAVKKGNHRLAGYISRNMPNAMQHLTKLYQRVDKTPRMVADKLLFDKDTSENRDIIAHGLRKYARKDAMAAHTIWQEYRYKHTFTAQEQSQLDLSIAIQLAEEGHIDHANQLAIPDSESNLSSSHVKLVTIILRALLSKRQWHDILVWIDKLPAVEKQSDRWRYWKARALAQKQTRESKEAAQSIYQALSTKRSYYGFLAADRIGSDYALVHEPAAVPVQVRQDVQAVPDLKRGLELFALDKMYTARHEWDYGTRKFTDEQHIAAAQLAANWGWNRKAIESMAAARHWDDLTIRFPMVNAEWISKASEQVQLPGALIYAVARQESAWATDALSSAGAVGLMQIMPATAKQTARKIGLNYDRKRLFQPQYNITIGSRYIRSLMDRYGSNRFLAVAAYNAGPSRVDRWLTESDQQLPYDVWVEVLPFKETRKYVQNVLTYAVIYGYITGKPIALIGKGEADQIL